MRRINSYYQVRKIVKLKTGTKLSQQTLFHSNPKCQAVEKIRKLLSGDNKAVLSFLQFARWQNEVDAESIIILSVDWTECESLICRDDVGRAIHRRLGRKDTQCHLYNVSQMDHLRDRPCFVLIFMLIRTIASSYIFWRKENFKWWIYAAGA